MIDGMKESRIWWWFYDGRSGEWGGRGEDGEDVGAVGTFGAELCIHVGLSLALCEEDALCSKYKIVLLGDLLNRGKVYLK